MGALDALWHVLNLFAPAIGMGLLVPGLAKLCWRQELAAVRWRVLALWVMGVCAIVQLMGLLVFGRDGRMATYAALVLAAAAVSWWRGWRWRRA